MAISWTLIVLGALLQGMQCNNSSTAAPTQISQNTSEVSTADSSKTTISSISLNSSESTLFSTSLESSIQSNVTLESSTPTSTPITPEPTKPSSPSSSSDSNEPTTPPINGSILQTLTETTLSVTTIPTLQNGSVTTHVTTNKPETQNTSTGTTPSSRTDTATNVKQDTTDLNTSVTTTSTEASTTQLLSTQTKPSPSNLNEISSSPITEAPDSKSTASQNPGTTKAQTTASTIGQDNINSSPTPQILDHYFDLSSSSSTEKNIVSEACKTLGQNMKGNCSAIVKIHDKQLIVTITINADRKISTENYKPVETDRGDAKNGTEDTNMETTPGTLTKNGTEGENKAMIPDTLIAIMASCGALVLILCCFAAYCTYHRRSYRKNQQHLTEELQTVENGYHDNPTLEVMEVQPEMQEKKLTMNGEFNDSWIVPIDNLLKEDIPDEEDTHL